MFGRGVPYWIESISFPAPPSQSAGASAWRSWLLTFLERFIQAWFIFELHPKDDDARRAFLAFLRRKAAPLLELAHQIVLGIQELWTFSSQRMPRLIADNLLELRNDILYGGAVKPWISTDSGFTTAY